MYSFLRALFGMTDKCLMGLTPLSSRWIRNQLIRSDNA